VLSREDLQLTQIKVTQVDENTLLLFIRILYVVTKLGERKFCLRQWGISFEACQQQVPIRWLCSPILLIHTPGNIGLGIHEAAIFFHPN
jgi:hypothetical protein